ncbi:MAG: hypothetical protein KatS3mg110_3193 [Pirellulaceae bacterium]|nr:MAG: hypothetical protein KatS3mg110_3193 [Pirellulaceae bacterium]
MSTRKWTALELYEQADDPPPDWPDEPPEPRSSLIHDPTWQLRASLRGFDKKIPWFWKPKPHWSARDRGIADSIRRQYVREVLLSDEERAQIDAKEEAEFEESVRELREAGILIEFDEDEEFPADDASLQTM